MDHDLVIVGAGPAGLATAIRLKQLAATAEREVSVVVLEKGSEPGAHILSGAIMDPIALTELFPDWKEKGAPLKQPVTEDEFLFLSESGFKTTPHGLLPDCFKNHGNYIVSPGEVTRWLAEQAEGLGVEIFPGFAAAARSCGRYRTRTTSRAWWCTPRAGRSMATPMAAPSSTTRPTTE